MSRHALRQGTPYPLPKDPGTPPLACAPLLVAPAARHIFLLPMCLPYLVSPVAPPPPAQGISWAKAGEVRRTRLLAVFTEVYGTNLLQATEEPTKPQALG